MRRSFLVSLLSRTVACLSLATVLLAVPPSPAASGQPVASADTVALRFDWPAGLEAEVDLRRVRVRASGEAADTSGVRVAYRLGVADHPQGRAVSYDGWSLPGSGELAGSQQQVLQLASSMVPGYVVSEEGELLEVDRLDEVRAELLGLLEELGREAPPELEAILGRLLSREALFSLAAQEWNALVGAWAGARFAVGSAYRMEQEQPVPALGGVVVPFRYEFGAAARVDCVPGGGGAACVELVMRSHPDPEALQPHLEAFVEQMLDAAGAGEARTRLAYRELELENEVILVAEPDGLVPHALTIVQSTRAVMELEGETQVATDRRETHYAYRWRARPGR